MVLSQGKGVQTLPSHHTRAKGSGNRKSEHNTSLIMCSRAFKTLKDVMQQCVDADNRYLGNIKNLKWYLLIGSNIKKHFSLFIILYLFQTP